MESFSVATENRLRVTRSGQVVDYFLGFAEFSVRQELVEADRKTVTVPDRFGGETDGHGVADRAKDKRLTFV